ncbi:hypothetical protein FO470_00345 [Starkeya sp. 3C]|uniref:DUF2127 domain-containing protein n=1 Tax=Ancylobacter moscoviensis TaxID=2597768 RepID=A0ABY3DTN8_9HYPH|nr:hypothetical protein [Ancylobacter moscoviensis]TSJ63796.1 hypothetical protein FO470_00345 [Ancylobacter moscoviensis]
MDNLLRLLLRFVVVPFGMIAGFIATFVVVVFGYWQLGDLISGATEVQALALADTLSAASMALSAVAMTMWAIAFVGILFAEAFAVRSWIFHAANGAVSAWLAASLFTPYPDTPVPFDGDLYIVGAGLAGGLVYWLVAGWSAGFWKPVGAARVGEPPAALPPSSPTPPLPPSPPPPAA